MSMPRRHVILPRMDVFQPRILNGKVALLTGGSSGIGLRIAQKFADFGATVCLFARNREKLDSAIEGIRGTGGAAEGFAGDVRDYSAVEQAVRDAAGRFGLIDIVVCAAAGNFPAPVAAMSPNGFKAVVDIDLLGTFNTCRAAYEHLRKPGACIISISANHGHQPYAYQAHVCAAKAGVDLFTRTIALEWGPEGVRANCITPGPIDETEGMRRLAPTESLRRQVIESVPLGRMGTKDDISNLALFLASEAGRFINGAVVVCDGGQSLAGSRDFRDAWEAAKR